jgi:hypothetical protein
MKPHPKYPESLIAHACHKAYAAMRNHYGPDPNDVKDPRSVEYAIRRDVIAVLEGATARQLHGNWRDRKYRGMPLGWHMAKTVENPTLGSWHDIPDHDKSGYRAFCAAVHEARRQYDEAANPPDERLLAKFPRAFRIQSSGGRPKFVNAVDPTAEHRVPSYSKSAVDELDSFLASKGHKQFNAIRDKLEAEHRLTYCGQVAAEVINTYYQVLGIDLSMDVFTLDVVQEILDNPSPTAVWQQATLLAGRRGQQWHLQDKRVQSMYHIYVAALVAAAANYDADE